MTPRIAILTEKKLIGLSMKMSLADNKTAELWRGFMSRRQEIKNAVDPTLYSMQIYDPLYFSNFNPTTVFEKWAAAAVTDFEIIPEGMAPFILTGGLYAVFLHYGAGQTARETFAYIFGQWLPGSEYKLDNRPHFELLGEKYKNNDPTSEEEIWIPLK